MERLKGNRFGDVDIFKVYKMSKYSTSKNK